MKAVKLFLWVVSARRVLILSLICCAIGVAVCELTIPWLVQEAIDTALERNDLSRLNLIGGMMLGVICALYLVHCLLLRLETRVLYQGLFRLRQRLYTHLLSQPLAYFSQTRTGELLHRVVSDTEVFEDNAAELFSDLPFELITVAGVLTLMAVTNPRLALVVVVFLLVASAVSAYVGRPLPTIRKGLQTVGAAFTARLQEALSGIRTVKAFGRERHEITRLDQANQGSLDLNLRGGRVEAFLNPVFDLMESLGIVLVIWYGAHLIIDKQITAGGLVAFLAYMEILAGPVSRADSYYGHFQKCRAVCDRLAQFLSESERMPAPIAPIPSPTVSHEPATIVFDEVSFRYSGGKRHAIDRISLTIHPGELVAFVGRNGAGKSTLMDLLLRFYDPTSGRVEISGIDLRVWDLDLWRETVGIMTQEVFLFHATIAENIAYGRPVATEKEIEAAAFRAGLGDLLRRLPMGLQTVVGDRGSRLSGGERQRIALARLFLKEPQVLIFDEPTAHLDGEALRDVTACMAELCKSRTTVLITHHPELLCMAQRVILLDSGRVLAEGRHDAMLASNSLYGSLLAASDHNRAQRQHRGKVAAGQSVA